MATWQDVNVPREDLDALKLLRKKCKFLVDECMGEGFAHALRASGYPAIWVGDVGLDRRDDEDVMAYAWRKDLVLLTHDDDFLDANRFPDHRNPGVVVLPGAEGEAEPFVRAVEFFLGQYGDGRTLLEKTRIRIAADGTMTITSVTWQGARWTGRFRLKGNRVQRLVE